MSNTQLPHTAAIVAAYLEGNRIAADALPDLIGAVHRALEGLSKPADPGGPRAMSPAKVRKSITPSHLISFEDGKPYALLKRHLRGHGLTPET